MAVKPTSLALNMEFMVPEDRGHLKAFLKTKHEVSSSELARWAPGMMREIARSITVNIQKRRVTMKALSWQEHLAQGHVPFRRDCAVCQRAAARDRPHRAQGIAAPCVLSLDLTGPFVLGHDIDGDLKKYLLVGAYTWPVMEEAPWDDVEQLEVHPDWPKLEEEEALREVEYDLAQDLEAHGEEMSYRPTSDEGKEQEMGDSDGEGEQLGEGDGDQPQPLPEPEGQDTPSIPLPKTPEEVEEHQKVYKMVTMSICLPLTSKSAAEVLAGDDTATPWQESIRMLAGSLTTTRSRGGAYKGGWLEPSVLLMNTNQREHGDKVEVVPGKAIHAVKAPDGRRKCRLGVCGNYLKGAGRGPGDRSEAAQLYAGGADTTCLRTSLALAATRGWQAASLDIKTAFLNAPLRTLQESSRKKVLALEDAHGRPHEDEGGDGGGHDGQEEEIPEEQQEEESAKRKRLVLMLPPKILIRLGLVKDGEMWLVERALYGLRESPKLWGTTGTSRSARCPSRRTASPMSTSRASRRRTCGWCAERMQEMVIGSRDSPWYTWMM